MKPGSRNGKHRRLPVNQSGSLASAADVDRDDPLSIYAQRIEAALASSSIQPTFLRVENISCQLLQRRLLGPTRYWFKSIKHDKTTSVASKKWVVSLYDIPWRKTIVERAQTSDRFLFPDKSVKVDLFPSLKPVLVGTFETERAATLACDAAWKGRDRINPVSISNDPGDPLPPFWNTHLHITVVSDAFHRKPHEERMRMVLQVLLLLSNPPPQATDHHSSLKESCGPETPTRSRYCQMTKFGTVGPCVGRLPHLRHLHCSVVLVLKTTHQFRPVQTADSLTSLPLTERLGLSHGLDRTLGIPILAKTTTKDVRRLVRNDQPPTKLPHFYHGLPAELKAMIAHDQSAQRAAHAALDRLSTQLQHNSEATVLKKFEKRKLECARAAIMLQRVYRLHNTTRVLRRLLASHRHALTIQRCYRGYVARVFVQEYFIVVSLASTHIQAVFRSHVSREHTKRLRRRMTVAAVHMQRLFRGHQARKHVFWIRFNVASAIQIQRVVRGMFGRHRAAMFRKAKHKRTVVVPAVTLIQRVYRGHVGRMRFRRIRTDRFVERVQVPAAMEIQRVARGYIGRQIAKQCRRRLVAALVIQDGFRKYRARCRWAFMWQVRFENRMASRIGAAGRGYLARKVYKRELRKVRLRTVYIPAARTIQRVYRGFVVRKHLEEFRDQVEAATVLQYFWRQKQKEAGERAAWSDMIKQVKGKAALTLQCFIRSYLARQRMQALRLRQRGRHGQAALVVQSAWRSYSNRKQITEMRQLMAIEVFARKFTGLKDNLEMVHFDTVDAKGDVAYITKHKRKSQQQIHDIKQMRLDWELRVPVLDKELAQMTRQDIERGWQEAFETEKVVIHFSMLLSAEEILSKKQQIREYDADIASLHAECEDLERDTDEFLLQETTLLEDYRRLEVQRASQQHARHTKESIRRQRLRWKVRTNRTNLVLRESAAARAAVATSLAPPPTSLSYAGHLASIHDTDELVRQHDAAAHEAKTVALLHGGSRNPHLLSVADAVVAECHKIISAGSMAMHLDRTDLRDEEGAMCHSCGHVQCVCHISTSKANVTPTPSTDPALSATMTKKRTKGPGLPLGRRRRHHRQTDGVPDSAG